MIFPFFNTPRVFRSYKGKFLGWAPLHDGALLGLFTDYFVIVDSDVVDASADVYAWADVLSASWDAQARSFHITFCDQTLPARDIVLADNARELVVPIVRSRVDESIYWRSQSVLPSGCEVISMIRVGRGGKLVSRLVFLGTPHESDNEVLAELRERMGNIACLDEE